MCMDRRCRRPGLVTRDTTRASLAQSRLSVSGKGANRQQQRTATNSNEQPARAQTTRQPTRIGQAHYNKTKNKQKKNVLQHMWRTHQYTRKIARVREQHVDGIEVVVSNRRREGVTILDGQNHLDEKVFGRLFAEVAD